MSSRRGACRIGTSGYQYPHWRGVFYPEHVPKREWFGYYASRFDTVEINNTFYNLPAESSFDAWRTDAPKGFCYALKFSRYGTHIKRLKDPMRSVRRFVDRAARLRDALGPILVQLPPKWNVDPDRLKAFLDAAPDRQRWTVEVRDERWLCDEVYRILERHGAALCWHDMIDDHPRRLTTDWAYLRFHGIRYGGSYSSQKLAAEAGRVRRLLDQGVDVYVYFNNDAAGHAVRNAADLRRYVMR